MRLKRRLDRLVTSYAARGAFDPPPTPPSREERLARVTRYLQDVGACALWGMHTPELWPALRDWLAAQTRDVDVRARSYLALHVPLLHAIEERKVRRAGQIGSCNALVAINHHYGERPHEVLPLPACPRCGCVHTDHAEALGLAGERMRLCWSDRSQSLRLADAEWGAVVPVFMDGLPKELGTWYTAHQGEVEAILGGMYCEPGAVA